MEAQREEMERQREQFQFKIERLGEKVRELEQERERSARGRAQKEDSLAPTHGTSQKETSQLIEETTIPSNT